MVDAGLRGVEFIAINTDVQALQACEADIKLPIGHELTKGLGAGANPDVGAGAAAETRDVPGETVLGDDAGDAVGEAPGERDGVRIGGLGQHVFFADACAQRVEARRAKVRDHRAICGGRRREHGDAVTLDGLEQTRRRWLLE